MTKIKELTITVRKTAGEGDKNYLQIMSEDQFFINIVLIADNIKVKDERNRID